MANLSNPPEVQGNVFKRALRRVWHVLSGHPGEQVYWGTPDQGAKCGCGARWTRADYH